MTTPCLRCPGRIMKKDGRATLGGQRFRCRACRRTCTSRSGTPFAGHRLPSEVIVTAVRWYFRYRLSLADVRDLLAERGIDVSARTILNWVHKFGPLLAAQGRLQARPCGRRWWVDEAYVRVAGRRAYLSRAVDEAGQVVDVLLRTHRDLESARGFFDQAIARRGVRPKVVITDKHAAYRRAVRRRTWRTTRIRTGLHRARGETTRAVERSHVPVKDRLRPMRGLPSIATGQRLLEGIAVTQAIRRGLIGPAGGAPPTRHLASVRARRDAAVFQQLAGTLRLAA
jgi:transposase, IS6 family